MGSITSANAIYMLAIPPLFAVPIQLQGFSADNIFVTDPVTIAETSMGLDGILSAGFVFNAKTQSISLQADSASNNMFDTWVAAQELIKDTFRANGVVLLTAINKKWTMTNGILTTYPPIPDAARTLQPRRFTITWEKVQPAAV